MSPMAIARLLHKCLTGGSLATMDPTAVRKHEKCQPALESCSFCVLPGSLAFHTKPDLSCMSRRRQDYCLLHNGPSDGAFLSCYSILLRGLEFLLASAGSHEHGSFIPTSLCLPSCSLPSLGRSKRTQVGRKSTQTKTVV